MLPFLVKRFLFTNTFLGFSFGLECVSMRAVSRRLTFLVCICFLCSFVREQSLVVVVFLFHVNK